MSRIIAAALLTAALTGCAGREWVKPVDVATELSRREVMVAQGLQTATGRARDRLRLVEGSLLAARRALDEGRSQQARVDLQVAIDYMDGVR